MPPPTSGVSDDTVRRWIDNGTPRSRRRPGRAARSSTARRSRRWRGRTPSPPPLPGGLASSARNRFVGIVTEIITDAVMAQVELQCGPFRVVSLMSQRGRPRPRAGARLGRGRGRQVHERDHRDARRRVMKRRCDGRSAALLLLALAAAACGGDDRRGDRATAARGDRRSPCSPPRR